MNKSLYSIYPYNRMGIRTVPSIDEDGDIYFDVYAYKLRKGEYSNELHILRLSENDEKCKARWDNLWFTQMGGWRVIFPDDASPWTKHYPVSGQQKTALGKWIKTAAKDMPNISAIYIHNLELMENIDPRLKYLIRALVSQKVSLTMKHVKIYRKYPREMELLIKNGYETLALNERIYKLNPKLKKELYDRLKKNQDKYVTLRDILHSIKYNITLPEVNIHRPFVKYKIKNVTRLLEYVKSLKRDDKYIYEDYLEMAMKSNKDLNDPYWAFPKNLIGMHDKLRDELERQERAKMKEEFQKIIKISNSYRKIYKPCVVSGYQIDFPNDIDDIMHQAKILNQCLITANYHQEYIDKKLMLVLIKKNDEPIATVEINKDKSIGQFYGNEHDRDKCLPPEDVKFAFNTWYNAAFNRSHQKGGFLK